MVDEQLVNWIKKGLSKGYSQDHLKDILKKQGHNLSDIENAIASISPPVKHSLLSIFKPSPKKRSEKWIWASIVGVLILFVFIFLYPSQPSTPSEQTLPAPKIDIPEFHGVINSFAFSSLTNIALTSKGKNSMPFFMYLSLNGKADVVNSAMYSKSYISSKILGKKQDILTEFYISEGKMYNYMDGNWMIIPVSKSVINSQISSVNPNTLLDAMKKLLNDSNFNVKIISKSPLHIKLSVKNKTKITPSMKPFFEGMIKLFSTGNMNFSMNDVDLRLFNNEIILDNNSRLLESISSIMFSWTSGGEKFDGRYFTKMNYSRYNNQSPIVVPKEAKAAGPLTTLTISDEQLKKAGLSREDLKKIMSSISLSS